MTTTEPEFIGYCSKCGAGVYVLPHQAERFRRIWLDRLRLFNTKHLAGARAALFRDEPAVLASDVPKVQFPTCFHMERVPIVPYKVGETWWYAVTPEEAEILHREFYGLEEQQDAKTRTPDRK